MLAAFALSLSGAAADAAFIAVDLFEKSGGDLDGNGVSVSNTPGATVVADTGINVLGKSRLTTLTLESVSGSGNPGVNLKIPGGSNQLQYKSDNNLTDGKFELLYNGTAGVPAFPLDFTNAGVIINVHFHTNPGSNFTTDFLVTLIDGANRTATATYGLTGGVSGGLNLLFGNVANPPSPSTTPSAFAPQASFNFSLVQAIKILVNPRAGTNIDLKSIETTAAAVTPVATPEPSTALLMLMGAAGYAGKRRLSRRAAAQS